MRKYFKNLPDKSTPLTGSRLNGFLNGEESIEKIVVGDIECKNIFDGELKKGVYLYADGTYSGGASALSGYVCSVNKTPIEAGKTLRFSTNYPSYQVGYVFYNNGTFVSSYVGRTVTVPEGANEFVVNIQKSADAEKIELSEVEWVQVEYGTEITDYVPHKKYGYNSQETMGKIVVDDINCKNLFNKDKTIPKTNANISLLDTGINVNSTAEVWSYGQCDIDCEPNKEYTVSSDYVQKGTQTTIACYVTARTTNTQITINTYTDVTGRITLTFVTPADGKIRVHLYNNYSGNAVASSCDFTNVQVEKGTIATEYTPYKSLGYTSGSNENGSWVKYDDGTLIQHGTGMFGDSGTLDDSYAFTELPLPFVNNLWTIQYTPIYVSAYDQNITLGTTLTASHKYGEDSQNNRADYVYRRLSYLPPLDGGQTALYACAIPYSWTAIGRWK